jgi:hypothetical protein
MMGVRLGSGRKYPIAPKRVHDERSPPIGSSVSALLERRLRPNDSNRVTCRVCFARIDLCLERVDDTPMYVYYRCPECDQWFTIRRGDLDRLRAAEEQEAIDGAR